MPRLIYGTAWKKARTTQCVAQALRAGFTGFDSAGQPRHYDEQGVGTAVQSAISKGTKRADIFLQSKFTPAHGQDRRTAPYDLSAPLDQQVRSSLAQSLSALGTDYLDSFLLHSPMPTHALTLEAWGAMEGAMDQGLVKQLGISNCYDPRLFTELIAQAQIKPAVVQNGFYPQFGYDSEIRRLCQENGIIYQSFWTLTGNPHIIASPTVTSIAQLMQLSPVQVFLRYCIQRGIAPLCGTTSRKHMQEALQSFDFVLPEPAMRGMDSMLSTSASRQAPAASNDKSTKTAGDFF
eukprot:gene3371-3856_t